MYVTPQFTRTREFTDERVPKSFQIKSMLDYDQQTENLLDAALLLCSLLNESIEFTLKHEKKSYGAKICSNTFPTLLLQQKKVDIGIILQASHRKSWNLTLL